MEDPKSKKTGRENPGAGGHGVGVPAKGDSAASNPAFDPGATMADAPTIPPPPPKPPSKPPSRPVNPDATMVESVAPGAIPSRAVSNLYLQQQTVLQPGDVIGARYEILLLLGEGGMGSVYKALDREVERTVALKLIRPELASNPAILARFKQELLTAHQVTHKNVIRIYDIAEADGVKFITMEFVEGDDLRRILVQNGKLAPEKAIEIIRQVCLALDAAHSAGIIHRDLKPQNIMQEAKTGRILVMDFGLARSIESEGMTQTGALLGTIEYMSPEQAMGKTLDGRSDIFAIGLIFYELLTGNTPFKADSAMASLLKRNQERALPAAEADSSIPKGLSDIVSKCLERDLEHRYQTVQEILSDLDAYQGSRPTLASIALHVTAPVSATPTSPWKYVSIGALVIIVLSGGWMLRGKLLSPSAPSTVGGETAVKAPEMSLAILPFRNASGDSSLDWLGATLADMLSTGVGQSAQMRVVSADRLQQTLSDLKISPETAMDPTMVGHIADASSANVVFWGKYVRASSDRIHIDGVLQDLKHQQTTPITLDASDKDLSGTVKQIAEVIRQHLAVSGDVLKDLKASSFQPSSKSAVALRDYTQGVSLLRDGRNLDAIKSLQDSAKEDPNFALAYARLAQANAILGYSVDAEKYSVKAVDLSQQLPQGEKYLIEAIHAFAVKDSKKAIAAYENLAKTSPSFDIDYTLGSLYADAGDYAKSGPIFAQILKNDPKNILTLWQVGSSEFLQGNPQNALDPLNKALSLAIQTDNQEQHAVILQALGISYRTMNKPTEAMHNYVESMEISKNLGMKYLLANNLSELAQVQITLGKPDAARGNYDQALQILKDIGLKKEYGDVLINRGALYQTRGDYDKAVADYKEALDIQRDANDETYYALCLSNIGEVYMAKGDTDDALIYYQQALQVRDKLNDPNYLTTTLNDLGDLYAQTGDYDKALSNLTRSLDVSRKANNTYQVGSASALIGKVLMYQGRTGAAVSALQDAVKAYRASNNRSLDMSEALGSLAQALALAGRGNESGKLLDEAREIAHDLKNEDVNGELLLTQGEVAYYRGDWKTAKSDYQQAGAAAAKAKQKDTALIVKANLARVAIAEGRPAAAIADLRAAIQQAGSLHLKYYAIRSAVDLGHALVETKDYAHAREQLTAALSQSEKLGLRLETGRIHFLLGDVLRLSGDSSEADGQYQQAQSIFDDLKKEPGAEHLLERSDLQDMYAAAHRSISASK
jgi:eukaryotic-like serine/threonine-protein kinase